MNIKDIKMCDDNTLCIICRCPHRYDLFGNVCQRKECKHHPICNPRRKECREWRNPTKIYGLI